MDDSDCSDDSDKSYNSDDFEAPLWQANKKLERQMWLQDYSVSNRGLRSGLVGTPDQVAERVTEFEDAGVNLLLLQCSPQLEEMERFAEAVINKWQVITAGN